MPRNKTQSPASLESPTSTADPTPNTSLLDAICTQSLAASAQEIEAATTSTLRVRGKSLHELTAELEDLDELIDSIDGEAIAPELAAAVQQLLEQRDDTYEQWLIKIDNYCAAITNRQALSKQRSSEAERLNKLAATDAKRADWMKQQLKNCLEAQGVKKLSLRRFQLTISKNGGIVPLKLSCPVAELPPQFQRVEISADNSAIRKALESGDMEAQKVAQFGERETHLRVR